MTDPRDELKARADDDGIEFFLAMFVDLHGKPCAKAVPIGSFDMLMDGGAGFAGFAAGDLGQSPADPDLTVLPDPASYTRVPWKPGVAVLHCDPQVNGEPWPYAPRVILKRELDRLAQDRGWKLKTGIEVEYALLRRTEAGDYEVADGLDTSAKPCYEVKSLTRMWDFLSTVSRNLTTWAGVTTPTTTRTATASSRTTSPTTRHWSPPIGRSSSDTWCTCWPTTPG